jgi:ribosome-binding factor A
MPSHRHERVRELLKRQIGEVLHREVSIPEAGLVSVHDVGLSGDLKSATVYVSFVGTPDQQKRGLALLHRERGRLQALLGKAVTLKYTPRLRFVADNAIERGNRVLAILDELERQTPAE